MKKFWKWKNQAPQTDTGAEIPAERVLELYGTIAEESWFDDDVTPKMFKDELISGEGPVTVWINFPGGDCVAASQIYAMLMDYNGEVTVKIDGLAASAASVIAMAVTKVLMASTALMMIHNPTKAYKDEEYESLYASADIFHYVGLADGDDIPSVLPFDEETCINLARRKREDVCFPVINRGQLWYEQLTEEQKTELDVWYKAWLDVTETLTIPEMPEWLEI